MSVVYVLPSARPAFDADARTIQLPTGLPLAHAVTLVRAILTELVVPQPEAGAVCWCGDPVDVIPLIPQQKVGEQVVKHGA
ncbi:hypothetical protein [Streptomyces sp. NWU339]|uniref:hypothetical protein n=1 Tax=Streptomyces sp. NWU339 TaxID=2185284 RepID=UPI0011B3FE0F|nr:hypothetical protein [Streptomyces sp. NWU339]